MSIITKGYGKGPIITQGYGLVSVIVQAFRDTIRFVLFISKKLSLNLER